MLRYVAVTLILAVVVGGLVVPFVIGLVKGPSGKPIPLVSAGSRLLSPLGGVARIYGWFLVLYVVATLLYDISAARKFPVVCANTPYSTSGGGGSHVIVRSGATLQSNGTVQVCTAHPTASQWLLYGGLIRLPNLALWAMVLLLVWRLIRETARTGLFTQRSAVIMQLLGLVVLAGTVIAAAVSAFGADILAPMLMVSPGWSGANTVAVDVLLAAPLEALLPWPALAGAALLSFGRIIGAGAKLDEEVKATV